MTVSTVANAAAVMATPKPAEIHHCCHRFQRFHQNQSMLAQRPDRSTFAPLQTAHVAIALAGCPGGPPTPVRVGIPRRGCEWRDHSGVIVPAVIRTEGRSPGDGNPTSIAARQDHDRPAKLETDKVWCVGPIDANRQLVPRGVGGQRGARVVRRLLTSTHLMTGALLSVASRSSRSRGDDGAL